MGRFLYAVFLVRIILVLFLVFTNLSLSASKKVLATANHSSPSSGRVHSASFFYERVLQTRDLFKDKKPFCVNLQSEIAPFDTVSMAGVEQHLHSLVVAFSASIKVKTQTVLRFYFNNTQATAFAFCKLAKKGYKVSAAVTIYSSTEQLADGLAKSLKNLLCDESNSASSSLFWGKCLGASAIIGAAGYLLSGSSSLSVPSQIGSGGSVISQSGSPSQPGPQRGRRAQGELPKCVPTFIYTGEALNMHYDAPEGFEFPAGAYIPAGTLGYQVLFRLKSLLPQKKDVDTIKRYEVSEWHPAIPATSVAFSITTAFSRNHDDYERDLFSLRPKLIKFAWFLLGSKAIGPHQALRRCSNVPWPDTVTQNPSVQGDSQEEKSGGYASGYYFPYEGPITNFDAHQLVTAIETHPGRCEVQKTVSGFFFDKDDLNFRNADDLTVLDRLLSESIKNIILSDPCSKIFIVCLPGLTDFRDVERLDAAYGDRLWLLEGNDVDGLAQRACGILYSLFDA